MQTRTSTQQPQHIYQPQNLQNQHQQMLQYPRTMSIDSNTVQVQSPSSIASSSHFPAGVNYPSAPRQTMPHSLTNSRMGPPNHLGQGSGSMGPTSTSASIHTAAHANVTPYYSSAHSESTSYFGPGAGLARLHQYSEALEEGPDRDSSEYWRSFVDEFFLPQSTMHLVLWNPTTREQKGFGE